jgi:3-oxoacyl-(acyl-carrier-protein) synthase
MENLSKVTKVTRVMNGVVAGTTDQNGDSVDMQNFEGVMFVASIGALTASQVTNLTAQGSSDDGSADSFADLLGTGTAAMADSDGDQVIVLDIYKPVERYIRPVLLRHTANAVIDGIVAIQYGPRVKPTTHCTTTVQAAETHVSPAEGTA